MSDMEHNKGKLFPFDLTEDVARELATAKFGENHDLPEYYDSYFEMVADDPEFFDLAVIDLKFYKLEWEIQRGELYGFAHVDKNKDGIISFNTWHYNGGGHWSEVVERALKEKGCE